MIKFRPLNADEIEVKVKQITEKGLIALLYKTARTDMDLLDEVVHPENWECDYEEIKGNLYCEIRINVSEKSQLPVWVSKKDCGIESREDGEGNEKKGEASDAFKRVGFKWGIGRALYTAPFIWINSDKANISKKSNGKFECKDKFVVGKIKYSEDEKKITELAIWNGAKGEWAFAWREPNGGK